MITATATSAISATATAAAIKARIKRAAFLAALFLCLTKWENKRIIEAGKNYKVMDKNERRKDGKSEYTRRAQK